MVWDCECALRISVIAGGNDTLGVIATSWATTSARMQIGDGREHCARALGGEVVRSIRKIELLLALFLGASSFARSPGRPRQDPMTMNDETRLVALEDIQRFVVVALSVAYFDRMMKWQMITLHSQCHAFRMMERT